MAGLESMSATTFCLKRSVLQWLGTKCSDNRWKQTRLYAQRRRRLGCSKNYIHCRHKDVRCINGAREYSSCDVISVLVIKHDLLEYQDCIA